jgi:hypothetical protein
MANAVSAWSGTSNSGRGRAFAGAERALDERLDVRRVEVADRHDRHQVGAVPVLVEALQGLWRKPVERFLGANRQPLAVARSLEEDGCLRILHPGIRTPSLPPFLDNDPALLVDGVEVERQPVRDVAEEQERLAHRFGVVGGHVQHVHGFVETRVGVHARPEPHADRFHELHQILLGEVLAAVEGHVLDEVRQPELIVVLDDGADIDGQPQFRAPERAVVDPDVVAKAVRKVPDFDARVDGNRLVQ